MVAVVGIVLATLAGPYAVFVQGIGDDENAPDQSGNQASIVLAIIAMAKGLNLRVVAEGVETPAQLYFLLRNGWTALSTFSLIGTYAALLRRLVIDENGEFALDSSRSIPFWPHAIYLIIAWLRHFGITPYAGFFISAGFFTVWSYLWYRYWVFPERAQKPPTRLDIDG